MNSTEFYIAAGEAICEWGKTHNEGCILGQFEGVIFCLSIPSPIPLPDSDLVVCKYEVRNGMPAARWTVIGTELHNLYCKELKCQTHQKH